MFQLFGISIAFVATRSGLLRWHDVNSMNPSTNEYGYSIQCRIQMFPLLDTVSVRNTKRY